MEVAIRADIQGIDAKCRGNCACVTCHVHIDPAWLWLLEPAGSMEESMLDFADDVDERSRLACQIRLSNACDGLRVLAPAEQRVLGL